MHFAQFFIIAVLVLVPYGVKSCIDMNFTYELYTEHNGVPENSESIRSFGIKKRHVFEHSIGTETTFVHVSVDGVIRVENEQISYESYVYC
jgi:hypothetical protein